MSTIVNVERQREARKQLEWRIVLVCSLVMLPKPITADGINAAVISAADTAAKNEKRKTKKEKRKPKNENVELTKSGKGTNP